MGSNLAYFRSLVLRIRNDPAQSGIESIAQDVAANLTFLDGSGTELFQIEGRWHDGTQPPNLLTHQTAVDLKTATIRIGTYRELDLVLMNEGSDDCYAFNNESYRFPNFEKPGRRLPPGTYRLRVHFRGPNEDQTFLLEFQTSIKDRVQPISCEEIGPVHH